METNTFDTIDNEEGSEPQPELAEVVQVDPPKVEVVPQQLSTALLQVGESMTPEVAQTIFDLHGDKIVAAVSEVQAYLTDLFEKQEIEKPGITSNILLPDNLMTWSQGTPYIRGYSDAAVPLAYVNFNNETGTGAVSIWFNWETGVVTTSLDG